MTTAYKPDYLFFWRSRSAPGGRSIKNNLTSWGMGLKLIRYQATIAYPLLNYCQLTRVMRVGNQVLFVLRIETDITIHLVQAKVSR